MCSRRIQLAGRGNQEDSSFEARKGLMPRLNSSMVVAIRKGTSTVPKVWILGGPQRVYGGMLLEIVAPAEITDPSPIVRVCPDAQTTMHPAPIAAYFSITILPVPLVWPMMVHRVAMATPS